MLDPFMKQTDLAPEGFDLPRAVKILVFLTLGLPDLAHPTAGHFETTTSRNHNSALKLVLGVLADMDHLVTEGLDHLIDVLLFETDGEPTRVSDTVLVNTLAINGRAIADLDVEGEAANHPRIH